MCWEERGRERERNWEAGEITNLKGEQEEEEEKENSNIASPGFLV